MDDIKYLLHLEALKRYSDDAKEIQRQVEEEVRKNTEAKLEYQREYQRLTKLNKNIMLCHALDGNGTHIDDSHAERTNQMLSQSIASLNCKNRPTKLNVQELDACKLQLATKHKPRCQLAKRQKQFTKTKEMLEAVCASVKGVESGIDTATLMAINQITHEFQVPKEDIE